MQRLTVLYDSGCPLCRQVRHWLEAQPAYCELRFLPAGSDAARRSYPGLDPAATLGELHVVDESGRAYRGAKAWIMCLYALRRYRGLALALGTSPVGMAIARKTVARVSRNRHQGWLTCLFPPAT